MNKGFLYAVLAALFLASGIIYNKYLLENGLLNSRMLGFAFFVSVFIGSSILFAFKNLQGFLKNLTGHWKDGIVVGGFNAMAASLFFMALDLLEASTTAFIVRFSTIFIIIVGVIFFREKLTKYDLIGIFFSVGGAFLLNYGSSPGSESHTKGVAIALLAAFAIAMHHITAKMYVKKTGALALVNVRVLFTSFFLFIVTLATDSLEPIPLIAYPILAIGGGVFAVAGFVFFYKALELEDVSKVAVIRTLDPFVVLIYSVFLFLLFPGWREITGGIPGWFEITGGSLIVVGVIIITLKNKIRKLVHDIKSILWLG